MGSTELNNEQTQKALGLLHSDACGCGGEEVDFRKRIITLFIELKEDDVCWNCLHDKFPGEGCYECGANQLGVVDGNWEVEGISTELVEDDGTIF